MLNSLHSQWYAEPVHPWRRLFARLLDTVIFGTVTFSLFGIVLYFANASIGEKIIGFLERPESVIIVGMLTTLFTTFPVSALIALTKTSFGKIIFGIKISDQDNNPISFKLALKRELIIWARGMGIGIGLVMLFTFNRSYRYLKYYKNTSWDSELKIKVLYREDSLTQKCLNVFGTTLYVVIMLFLWNL